MRVERLNKDKVKIFLSYEDLKERGVAKEDIWSDAPEVHDLLNDIMDEVYDELGFEIFGAVAIEVYALPTQGVIVIITRSDSFSKESHAIYQVDIRISPKNYIAFTFEDFEDLITAVLKVKQYIKEESTVFHLNNSYIFFVDENNFATEDYGAIFAILSEYGALSSLTKEYIFDYAKPIIAGNAVEVIMDKFK